MTSGASSAAGIHGLALPWDARSKGPFAAGTSHSAGSLLRGKEGAGSGGGGRWWGGDRRKGERGRQEGVTVKNSRPAALSLSGIH